MSSPALQFDPYHEWLDIPPHESAGGRPDHYRLLGLARFETDLGRIASAADERMARVREVQVGPRGRLTQQILNELAAAKICLLSSATKATYDAELSRVLSAAMMRQRIAPVAAPPPVAGSESPAANDDATVGQGQSTTPWWRIVLSITAATLVVLVAVLVVGVIQQRWHVSPQVTTEIPKPHPAESELAAGDSTWQVQEGSGEVTLAAATAKLAGGVELRHTAAEPVLANWTAKDAAAQWRFRLIQPGFFNVELKYAALAEASGTHANVTIGQQSKSLELRASGGLAQLHTDTLTIAVPASGQHTFVLRTNEPLDGDWFVLHSVRLIPVGGATPPAILPEPEGDQE